jgi:PIN domain nuclease of toxin-antitoxin system
MVTGSPMIHLDTHVVVWLYAGEIDRFPPYAAALLRAHRPLASPMVRVELSFLHEIGRITVDAATILDALRIDLDLGVAGGHFETVAARAMGLSFTRDPFDRLIAAHALADDLPLITKDRTLLARCPVAVWEG